MAFEYLLTALPRLPRSPGARPAIAPSQVAQMCRIESDRLEGLSAALLCAFDIAALERMALGAEPSECATIAPEKLQSREDLPVWLGRLLGADTKEDGYPFDAVWGEYFKRLAATAVEFGSDFLLKWACFDSRLRSAVAAHRAKGAGVTAPVCEVCESCPDQHYDFKRVLDELISQKERDGDRWREQDLFLAEVRLAKARELADDYSFGLDEVMGYLAQYMVLWQGSYLS